MATEKIGIEVEVKGAEKTISSFKDLKTAIKAAKDEQIAMTSKFGEGSIEATKAGQKLAGLKDKVEDLNDSTKSLKGSGVERLTSSFRLLGEGLGTFDFDKIKTGFKGVGAAMGAIPIFLLIEGLKYLYDNFDKVIELYDDLTGSIKEQTKSVEELNTAMEKQKNQMTDIIEKNETYVKNQMDVVKNTEKIKDLEAKGGDNLKEINKLKKESIDLEIQNLRAIRASQEGNLTFQEQLKLNTEIYQKEQELKRIDIAENAAALKDKAEKNKLYNDKRAADEKKLLADIENAKEQSYIKTLKSEQTQSIAKAQFDNDKLIEDINKSNASKATKNKALAQAEITLQDNILQIQKDYKVKQEAIEKAAKEKKEAQDKADNATFLASQQSKASKLLSILESGYQLELEKIENNDLLKLQKEQEHVDEVYRINVASANLIKENTTSLDNKYAKDKLDLEKRIAAETKKIKQDEIKQGFENVKNGLQAAQGLSDIYFSIKSAKVKKGSKEEEDLARKQFNVQKAFNLAKVGMDGYMAISNIIATTPKADFGISTGLLLAASAISTAANLAKIGAAQFEGGAGGGGGASPESAVSIPSTTSQAPAIYGPGQGQSTTFSGNQNNNFAPVKAYVVETENRSTTNRVNKLVSESTYG
jgi:hypothetical protein